MLWPGAASTAQAVTTCFNQAMPKAYELPLPGETFDTEIFYLGALCKRGHDWGHGQTLRTHKGRKCILCDRIDGLERQARQRAADPEAFNTKRAAYIRNRRATHGRESRSKHGLPHGFLEANGFSNGQALIVTNLLASGLTVDQIKERLMIDRFIKDAGRSPSVARLVYEQQIQHWRKHPADRAEHQRQYAQWRHHWKYAMDVRYRLYHRSKSRKRKAQERGSRTVMLSTDQLWRRWVEFDHRCAYCGTDGDLQVEHVIPISKGGEHHLGNIVPACQSCNFSKGKADAEPWYRSQSYFDETRWNKIVQALAKGQPKYHQPTLLDP